MAKKKKVKRFKCLRCGAIKHSDSAMLYHIKHRHGERMLKGQTWERVGSPTTAPKTTKKKIKKAITPNTQYIEVPAIIRIPVTMGPIQIVSIGE